MDRRPKQGHLPVQMGPGALTGSSGRRYTARASMASGPDPGDPWVGVSTGWAITSYFLGGVIAWGGIGYLIDWLIGTPHVFLAIGMVAGAALSTYLVWLRYGREDEGKKP
jgi:ATP synthase protein I